MKIKGSTYLKLLGGVEHIVYGVTLLAVFTYLPCGIWWFALYRLGYPFIDILTALGRIRLISFSFQQHIRIGAAKLQYIAAKNCGIKWLDGLRIEITA